MRRILVTPLLSAEFISLGKLITKKDDYLMTTMQVPPKQRMTIRPFDLRTQRDAFSVSLEGIAKVSISCLCAAAYAQLYIG